MGETKELLVDEIEEARSALDRDLTALESRVKKEADVRMQVERQVEKRPWLVAVAAIGCGIFLGMIFAALSPSRE